MKLILYNNKADSRVVDKTPFLSAIVNMEGTLRSAVSINNPNILIEFNIKDNNVVDQNNFYVVDNKTNEVVYNMIEKIVGCNYAYIKEFNRYYYVTSVTCINNRLWSLSMSIDVLHTFKDNILELDCLIDRNENKYNSLLEDAGEAFSYDKKIVEIEPTMLPDYTLTSFGFNDLNLETLPTSNIVVTLNKGSWIGPGSDFNYPPLPTDAISKVLPRPDQLSINSSKFKSVILLDSLNFYKFATYVRGKQEEVSYIDNISVYPFDLETFNNGELYDIYLGGKDPIGAKGKGTKYEIPDYIINAAFTIEGTGSYLDYDPYSKYELYIPYYGWIDLDPQQVLNDTLLLIYSLDFDNTQSTVYLTNETKGLLLFSANCQLGVTLGISYDNSRDIKNQKTNLALATMFGSIKSGANMVGAASSGNVGKAVAEGAGMVGNVAMAGIQASQMYLTASATNISGIQGVYSPQRVRIRKTTMTPLDTNNSEYLRLYGKPLHEYHKLKDMKGFTTILETRVDNMEYALENEKSSIDALLKSGIIL